MLFVFVGLWFIFFILFIRFIYQFAVSWSMQTVVCCRLVARLWSCHHWKVLVIFAAGCLLFAFSPNNTTMAWTTAAALRLKSSRNTVHGALSPVSRSCFITKRYLNRVLFEAHEVCTSDDQHLVAKLPVSDARSKHIQDILKLQVGDFIKCGIINRGVHDAGRILHLPADEEEGEEDEAKLVIQLGRESEMQPTKPVLVDLILAVPRPLRLERILPIVTCLGVNRLFLVGAKKVEKQYFGSHLFRRPDEMKALLVEGLSQAANDCTLPEVIIEKSLYSFLNQDFERYFKPEDVQKCLQLVAHPPKPSTLDQSVQMHDLFDEAVLARLHKGNCDRVVIAVGPEGGWEDGEIAWFQSKGFNLVDLGPRILRTDIAVPVLLGIANEWLAARAKK